MAAVATGKLIIIQFGVARPRPASNGMNIWLDDLRDAPEELKEWVHVQNLDELEELVEKLGEKFEIDVMSFDYNLGHVKNGLDVMKYLADLCEKGETGRYWPKEIRYHTNDPMGEYTMRKFAENFKPVY